MAIASRPSDEELLRAVQERKPGAFDLFVERYGRRLLAFGLRMCRHRADAEEVFQETLLKAYEGLEKLRNPGALRTWLYRVAANQCRMMRRRDKPSRSISLEELKPAGWDEGEMVEIPDWSDLPEDEAARRELRGALEEAIHELPHDHKIVLVLRDVEGLSTRETAEALELGVSAVKMRLHRARLALRQALSEEHERWIEEGATSARPADRGASHVS